MNLKLIDLANKQHPLRETNESKRSAFDASLAIDISQMRMMERWQGTHSIDDAWEIALPQPVIPILLQDLQKLATSDFVELFVVLESIRLSIQVKPNHHSLLNKSRMEVRVR